MENLKYKSNRNSTCNNYLSIWREFNKFIIRLDNKPNLWEDRVGLFAAYLVDRGRKSSTIKSYISAIKFILKRDNYEWDDSKAQLNALTKACKLQNDIVKIRLPISDKLLDLILFEVDRIHNSQPYLMKLYQTILVIGYYGLLRIGEMTQSEHQILARNVHVATNKKKIKIILFLSKTHDESSKPQKVTISSEESINESKNKRYYCPFQLTKEYILVRGIEYADKNEPFFLFRDKSNITANHVRILLRQAITNLNLDANLYDCHSLRIGKCVDMKRKNMSISQIMLAGRWRSNAVFRYLNG